MSEFSQYISSAEEIIEDTRNGKMIVLVDAEDRENEGDLIIPAQMATPDAINFMAKFGRGLICLTLMKDRADQLGLELMSQIIGRVIRQRLRCRLKRARASRPAFRHMTAPKPYRWPSTRPKACKILCRRAMCFRWLRAMAAC